MYSCFFSVTSGFCHTVDENCTIVGYYAVRSGKLLAMLRDNLSVPSLGIKNPKVKMGPIGCPKMLERNYHYMLHSSKEEHSSELLLQSQLTPHKEHTLSGFKNILSNLSSYLTQNTFPYKLYHNHSNPDMTSQLPWQPVSFHLISRMSQL
jgi:hypothetical protein